MRDLSSKRRQCLTGYDQFLQSISNGQVGIWASPLISCQLNSRRCARFGQSPFQPHQLRLSQYRFLSFVYLVVGGSMVTNVEHEEIHITPGEFEIDTGAVGLAA